MASTEISTIIHTFLILLGSLILGASIVKMQDLFRAIPLIGDRSKPFILRFLKINRLLMIFFLLGYIGVALSMFFEKEAIGEFIVSLVFLFGAIFVMLVIMLNARMLNEIQNTIQGLVPICMECKKIRIEGGDPKNQKAWKEIETYISQRTDAKFSHGLCPSCLQKVMDRLDE